VSLVAEDGECENFHRSVRALPAARGHAGRITCRYDIAGHSLNSRLCRVPGPSPSTAMLRAGSMHPHGRSWTVIRNTEKRKVVRQRHPTENLAYALRARAPEMPPEQLSITTCRHQQQPANMKLGQALNSRATHGDTLVMRSSLGGDEDQGAEAATVVRDRRRRARCVPDRPAG
jgi:hypothetical protein